MDIRAFGSVFGQTSSLPYASGFVWTPAQGPKSFSTSRAIFVVASGVEQDFYVQLNDMPGQYIRGTNFNSNYLCPLAVTALSGGTIPAICVFF
jgi:hypothetical protein